MILHNTKGDDISRLQGDPLRKFYTSLLKQRPESEMARRWCAMHGLLPEEEAAAWVEQQAAKRAAQRPSSRQGQSRGSPAKRPQSSASVRAKERGAGSTWVDGVLACGR